MTIRRAGIGQLYTTDVIFAIDGAMVTLKDVGWVREQPTFNYWDSARLEGQESLIRKIARANEIWLTVVTSEGRASAKLSATQIILFKEMLERYDSLNPK